MTGDQYRVSLNDGRETYFEGKVVDDVSSHPMLGADGGFRRRRLRPLL